MKAVELDMRAYLEGSVEIVRADIKSLDLDAIVNAANVLLLGGGGIGGAIHRVAGPELLAECRALGGARPDEAKMTKGYGLAASYVIHAGGPVWTGGSAGESDLLASCYETSLELVLEAGVSSVAFPSISIRAYGYPIERAARVAEATVRKWLEEHELSERVLLCCFSDADSEVYESIANEELSEVPRMKRKGARAQRMSRVDTAKQLVDCQSDRSLIQRTSVVRLRVVRALRLRVLAPLRWSLIASNCGETRGTCC